MSITPIKEAVMKLSTDELTEFLEWLDEFQQSQWERQIEADLKAGKLDHLIKEAEKEIRGGRYREI